MAKKLKFPLMMKGEIPVRTMEELKENFDFEKILEYYQNGKLLIWLQDRYYENESEALKKLDKDSDTLRKDICEIFSVSDDQLENIDLKKIQEKMKKIEYLKQFTDDNAILGSPELVVANQVELDELDGKNLAVVYLCEGKYVIPVQTCNRKYIGIGTVKGIIKHKKYEELVADNILFEMIELLDEAEMPLETITIEEAEKLFINYRIEEAASMLKKLSNTDNGRAQFMLGIIYADGAGTFQQNRQEALDYFKIGKQNGDILCRFRYALDIQDGLNSEYDELFVLMKKEAESGDVLALYEYGLFYLQNGSKQDYSQMASLMAQVAEMGYWRAWRSCGLNYERGRGVDVSYAEAKRYYLKAVELGDREAKQYLGEMLVYNLNEIDEGCKYLKDVYTSEVLREQANRIINEAQNIKSSSLSDVDGLIYSVIDGSKRFSSKSAAINYANNELIKYINLKLKTYSVNNPYYNKFEDYYINIASQIIQKANILIQIADKINNINSSRKINNIESKIAARLRELLGEYARILQNIVPCRDIEDYIYDSTEHNGFFNSTKYWVDYCVNAEYIFGKEYGPFYTKDYDEAAYNFVKSTVLNALVPLKNF